MVTEQQQKEANKLISEKIETIANIMKECAIIAEANEVYFSFNPLDIWGMGGSYCPKSVYIDEHVDDLDSEQIQRILDTKEPSYNDYWGWRSSSMGC